MMTIKHERHAYEYTNFCSRIFNQENVLYVLHRSRHYLIPVVDSLRQLHGRNVKLPTVKQRHGYIDRRKK